MDCGRVVICSDHGDGLPLGVFAANGPQCDSLGARRLWSAVHRVLWLNGRHVPDLCAPIRHSIQSLVHGTLVQTVRTLKLAVIIVQLSILRAVSPACLVAAHTG